MSLLAYPSHAYIIPEYATKLGPRNESSRNKKPTKKPTGYILNFAAAMGIIMAAVIVGTALICVFAHCWRQIIDYARRGKSDSAKRRRRRIRRLHKDESSWVFPTERGVPKPRFERLESEPESPSPFEQIRWPGTYAAPGYYSVSPGLDKGSIKQESQIRPTAHWHGSSTTLSSRTGSEKIERPASVAYVLDRP